MFFSIGATSTPKTEVNKRIAQEAVVTGSALHKASTGEESAIVAPPVAKTFDIDQLAYCVAVAETNNCTKGMGVTKNNCFGIMHWPNGKRTGKTYLTRDDSYADFKRIWMKSYGSFPTYSMAVKWTGSDNSARWLANVTDCYNK